MPRTRYSLDQTIQKLPEAEQSWAISVERKWSVKPDKRFLLFLKGEALEERIQVEGLADSNHGGLRISLGGQAFPSP